MDKDRLVNLDTTGVTEPHKAPPKGLGKLYFYFYEVLVVVLLSVGLPVWVYLNRGNQYFWHCLAVFFLLAAYSVLLQFRERKLPSGERYRRVAPWFILTFAVLVLIKVPAYDADPTSKSTQTGLYLTNVPLRVTGISIGFSDHDVLARKGEPEKREYNPKVSSERWLMPREACDVVEQLLSQDQGPLDSILPQGKEALERLLPAYEPYSTKNWHRSYKYRNEGVSREIREMMDGKQLREIAVTDVRLYSRTVSGFLETRLADLRSPTKYLLFSDREIKNGAAVIITVDVGQTWQYPDGTMVEFGAKGSVIKVEGRSLELGEKPVLQAGQFLAERRFQGYTLYSTGENKVGREWHKEHLAIEIGPKDQIQKFILTPGF